MRHATAFCVATLLVFAALSGCGDDGRDGTKQGDPADERAVGKLFRVAAVERAAREHPSAPPPEEAPALFREAGMPGNAARRCVDVNPLLDKSGRGGAIRSGEMVAGPFPHFVDEWNPHNANKLWWATLHTERMPGLTARAVKLDGSRESVVERYTRTAYAGDLFYPGGIRLPSAGSWRLVATSGPDWGCFEVEVSR